VSKPGKLVTTKGFAVNYDYADWYKIEASHIGEEDWCLVSNKTFDSEENAESWVKTHGLPGWGQGYEFRLVRVQTYIGEVGRWEL
jgi:hypothetical protein